MTNDELKMRVSVLRRQKTCLEKRVRQLTRERSPEMLRVVRWSRRIVDDGAISFWNWRQLKLAVKALEKVAATPSSPETGLTKTQLRRGRRSHTEQSRCK